MEVGTALPGEAQQEEMEVETAVPGAEHHEVSSEYICLPLSCHCGSLLCHPPFLFLFT